MAKNRLDYLLILFFVFLFHLFFVGYLSYYVFWAALLLPLFSLLCSLPAMLGVRAEIHTGALTAAKEEPVSLRLEARTRFFLPGGRIRLRLTVQNSLTGEDMQETFFLTAGYRAQFLEHRLSSLHCGKILCTLTEVRVYDYLGLFSFRKPLKNHSSASVLCLPKAYPIGPEVSYAPMPQAEGERYSPYFPGDDPSEIFDLREYREGDRLSRIHWKLSEKTGKTLVKEMGLPVTSHLLFLLDLRGDREALDCRLDALASLAAFLVKEGVPFHVMCPGTGPAESREIVEESGLLPLWESLLSGPFSPEAAEAFPPKGWQPPPGISHTVLLGGHTGVEEMAVLRNLLPGSRFTLLCTAELPGFSAPDVLLLPLLPEKLPEILNSLLL